ncbi:MAG: SDR family oxidoreductase [Bacteroidota bacterium]
MSSTSSKIILVTGANRGIGFAVAKGLAQKNHQVILTSRRPEDGQEAVEKLGNPNNLFYHQLDVDDEESVQKIHQFVRDKFGRLDGLINNAGINYDTYQNIVNADLANVLETITTNLIGPWRMIQTFLPLLRKSKLATITNVSSGLGAWSSQDGSSPGYNVSKLGLNGLTVAFAQQLAHENILINAVSPGWVRTDMGGMDATRSPEKGAETIIWAALLEDKRLTGKFFRDKEEISW